MTNLLKLSVLATMSALFAYGHTSNNGMDSDSTGVEISVEVQGSVNQVSWAAEGNTTIAPAADDNPLKGKAQLYDHVEKFEHRYSEKADDIVSSFSGKVVGKYSFSDDMAIALYAGAEAGMKDGQSYPIVGMSDATTNNAPFSTAVTVGAANGLNAFVRANLLASNHANKKIEPKLTAFGGARLLYGNVGIVGQYDLKKFDVKNYHATSNLNKEYKDSMLLVGFYGSTNLDVSGDMNFSLFVEGLTNLRAKSDSEMKDFWTKIVALSEGNDATTTPNTSVGEFVSNYNKLSVGLGVNFANF